MAKRWIQNKVMVGYTGGPNNHITFLSRKGFIYSQALGNTKLNSRQARHIAKRLNQFADDIDIAKIRKGG